MGKLLFKNNYYSLPSQKSNQLLVMCFKSKAGVPCIFRVTRNRVTNQKRITANMHNRKCETLLIGYAVTRYPENTCHGTPA